MNDFEIQANYKVREDLINVRGDSIEEFEGKLDALLDDDGALVKKIAETGSLLRAVAAVVNGGLTGAPVQQPPAVAQAPVAQGFQAPPPAAGGFTPGQFQTLGTISKWEKLYEGELPNAPMTPRGPAIKVTFTSKAGKITKRWEDPCKHPNFRGDRKPEDMFEGDWAN